MTDTPADTTADPRIEILNKTLGIMREIQALGKLESANPELPAMSRNAFRFAAYQALGWTITGRPGSLFQDIVVTPWAE